MYSWPQNRLKWDRGSEKPAAHTQQNLTQVPPRTFTACKSPKCSSDLNASLALSLTCALLRHMKLSTPYFDYFMKHSLSFGYPRRPDRRLSYGHCSCFNVSRQSFCIGNSSIRKCIMIERVPLNIDLVE